MHWNTIRKSRRKIQWNDKEEEKGIYCELGS